MSGTHASTGFSIFRKAVLSFMTTTESISSFRYIFFTGLRLWDAATGAALPLSGISGWVNSVTISPDSEVVHIILGSNDWVAEGQRHILWLPPDYRPTCEAACKDDWNGTIV
jgi:hypothetical protein